jgi:hypothetical protein
MHKSISSGKRMPGTAGFLPGGLSVYPDYDISSPSPGLPS